CYTPSLLPPTFPYFPYTTLFRSELERLTVEERLEDAREGHVRALPRPVDREVPQRDHIETEATRVRVREVLAGQLRHPVRGDRRSEEHTSELQSRVDLVCRLLLE